MDCVVEMQMSYNLTLEPMIASSSQPDQHWIMNLILNQLPWFIGLLLHDDNFCRLKEHLLEPVLNLLMVVMLYNVQLTFLAFSEFSVITNINRNVTLQPTEFFVKISKILELKGWFEGLEVN